MVRMRRAWRRLFAYWLGQREIVRDVSMLFVTLLVVWSLIGQQRIDSEQNEGRRIGSAITCAATSAIIDAGVALLKESARQRGRDGSEVAARYARHIARAVRAELRRVGASPREAIVRPDGSLDCDALREAARITR